MTDINLNKVPGILEISSRLRGSIEGTSSSDGASCNTFVVQDSIDGDDGIASALAWAMKISKREGAPTLVLSNLRGKGAAISTGGVSSGVIAFARMFDEVAAGMLRATKKNGVTVLFLDADHPDIYEWIQLAPSLKRAYTGVLFRPGKKYSPEILTAIAEAYNDHRVTFLCKVTKDSEGRDLYPNVCTEIRQLHRGLCTLSAIKIYTLHDKGLAYWVKAAVSIGQWKYQLLETYIKPRVLEQPDLYQWEPQCGIGLVGFANLLGLVGVSYEEMVTAFSGIQIYLEDQLDLEELAGTMILLHASSEDPALKLWCKIVLMYITIAQQMPGYHRIFTQQPTAHTALRLTCNYGDGEVYSVSPEIAPPLAVRGSDGLSRVTQASEIKGNRNLTYHDSVEIQSEVPSQTHQAIAECFQIIWDYLECGHTISYSTYQDDFSVLDLNHFLTKSPLGSLYYRLVPQNTALFSKSATLDDAGDLGDLFEDDDEPAPDTGFCPINPADRLGCETCSM